MGITIHFEGKLRGEAEYLALLGSARSYAAIRAWPCVDLPTAERLLKRVRDAKKWDYSGRTRGIIVHPHQECEPLRLEFDEDLYIQEFCKTQFAGPGVHIEVVQYLQYIAPLFISLKVDDEGEYWNSGDEAQLSWHMRKVDDMISDLLAEKTTRQSMVRLPSGRIVDLIG